MVKNRRLEGSDPSAVTSTRCRHRRASTDGAKVNNNLEFCKQNSKKMRIRVEKGVVGSFLTSRPLLFGGARASMAARARQAFGRHGGGASSPGSARPKVSGGRGAAHGRRAIWIQMMMAARARQEHGRLLVARRGAAETKAPPESLQGGAAKKLKKDYSWDSAKAALT